MDTLVRHIDLLRAAVRGVRQRCPFHIDAWVVPPDHLHCLCTLREGDDDFSTSWRFIKTAFAKVLPITERRSAVRLARHERAVWQQGFWVHAVHFSPEKHGYGERVGDWPYSSFHRLVA